MQTKAKILLGDHEVLSNLDVTIDEQGDGETSLKSWKGDFYLDTHPPAEFDENEKMIIELSDSRKGEMFITAIQPLEAVNNYLIRFQGSGALK